MASLQSTSRTARAGSQRPAWYAWAWWLVRVAGEAALINLAFLAAYGIRYNLQDVVEESWRSLDDFTATRLLLTVCIIGALQAKGLYRLGRGIGQLDEAAGVAAGVTIGFALTIVAGVALQVTTNSRGVLVYAWLLTVVGLLLWRLAGRLLRRQLWRRGFGIERVIVVGANGAATRVMQALAEQPLGYRLVGFVDDSPREELTLATQHRVVRLPRLGAVHDLAEVVRRQVVDEVFIALPSASHEQVIRLLATCRERAVRFKLVPDLFEVSFDQVQVDEINGVPLIGLKSSTISGWNAVVKRGLDVTVSLLTLILGAPLLALIALAIRLDSPGPVLFRQVRVGRHERPFVCFKFRTMCRDAEARKAELLARNEADGALFKIRDDPRRTRVGRWLRRTSLDELPQILNVLRGEMSWVGPRPTVPEEVAQYEEWHRQRLQVLPGMTGLWQVSGRSDLSFDEMVLLDLYYAEHWSLWLDLKIMLRTIPAMLMARGAY